MCKNKENNDVIYELVFDDSEPKLAMFKFIDGSYEDVIIGLNNFSLGEKEDNDLLNFNYIICNPQQEESEFDIVDLEEKISVVVLDLIEKCITNCPENNNE